MRQKLKVDIGGTLELAYSENSIQQVPTSGTITIYDDGGAEKVAVTAVTIDAAGKMTYDVAGSVADDVYYNWKADWVFVVGGVTHYRSTLFYVVRHILRNPVVDSYIIEAAPFLKSKNYSSVITADSGSKTTIISVNLTEDDDYWNGGSAEVISGTNIGETRKVTDFVASTNTLTVESFSAIIDATSKVVITRTFKKEIDRAFERFEVDMKNSGKYIDRIIDNEQVKEYVILLALHFICDNFANDPVDNWTEKAKAYLKDYKTLLASAVFDYDTDDDGNIESDEEKNALMQSEGVR